MNSVRLFSSEKQVYKKESYNKSPQKKLSSNYLSIYDNIDIIEEHNNQKALSNIKSHKYNSPNIKAKHAHNRVRRFSTKDLFRTKNKRNIFNLEKRYFRKSSRKLSSRNTKIFSELIRNSMIKRQNEEERFKIIIKCLLTNFKLRTFEDLNAIKSFLKENKIVYRIINEKMNAENEELFRALSYEMEYKYLLKKEKLFEISDKVDNIYLIIKGRVELYEHTEYNVDLTLYKYMKYIYDLYYNIKENNKNLELYKLRKTIESNSNIVNIGLDDIPYFIGLLVKIKFNLMINNNNYNIFSEDLEEIIIDCKNDPLISLKNFDFDKEKRNDDIYIKDIINNLYKKIPKISQKLIKKYYSNLNNNEDEFYTFKKFTLRKICELKDGDFLGEDTVDNNLERKCSVISLEDTHLAFIDYDLYMDIVNKYNDAIKDKDAKFLKDSFYFKRISLQYFIKHYFPDFSYQELTYGNNILNQNNSFEYIYFLKEGIVEIFCNQSVVEIIDLVKKLSQKLKNNSEEIKNELLNINNKLYLYGRINKNFTINNTSRLLIIPNADILGIESWITEMPYFYNCKIISDKAKFFKITLDKINNLFNYVKESKAQFIEDANKRLELLCRRLIKIINIRIQYFNKYNYYKEIEKKIFKPNIIIKENNNLLIKKKIFSSKKIKDLLITKSQSNKEREKEKENQYNKHNQFPFFHLTYTNIINKRNNHLQLGNINYTENNDRLAKTLNFKTKNPYVSLKLNSFKNRNTSSKIGFTHSEKTINSKQLTQKTDDNEKVVNKEIYSIKGELRLLNNLKNVLEGELLLSKRKKYKKIDKNNIMNDIEMNTIKKAKTFSIHKIPIDNEIHSNSQSRKLSMNTDFDYYNLTINSYFHINEDKKNPEIKNSVINRRISESSKISKNNNININSFERKKNKLYLTHKDIIEYYNKTQKSLKIFHDNNDYNKSIENYKFRFKEKKYCLTERDKYKKTIYKLIHKKIKDTNYFYEPLK